MERPVFFHKYCYHAYIKKDMYDMYDYSTWIGGKYIFYENGSHSYVRKRGTEEKVLERYDYRCRMGFVPLQLS